jgi:glycerophosphoryl diester phosphodiesterase
VTAWAYLDHPGPIAFAHRGGASEHPENTMPAFEHAVRLGYRYLETDAHTTSDGVLLAFHDPVLDRVTDRHGIISTLPWEKVRQARLAGDVGIPLMEELLTAWPHVRVNIDLKHDGSLAPMAAVIERTGTHDRVCVASFSGRRLDRFRRLTAGRVCTAIGPMDIARLRVRRRLRPGAGAPGARADRRPALRRRGPRAGPPRARVDDRRPPGHGATARPRRRRDHDRPPHRAQGGPGPAGPVDLRAPRRLTPSVTSVPWN